MRLVRFAALAFCVLLSGCGPMLAAGLGLAGTAAPPPQVQQAAQIARAPVDFALHAFDGALYAFDLAMDLKRPAPGSPEAKRIAGLGRRVLAALGAVDAAQKAGSATTYEQAFRDANAALDQFKQALGVPSATAAIELPSVRPILTRGDREAVLARATTSDEPAAAALLGGN